MQVAEEKACMIWYHSIDKAIKFKHKWGDVTISVVTNYLSHLHCDAL